MENKIYYRKRRKYKYYLARQYRIHIPDNRLWPEKKIATSYCEYNCDGTLIISAGYGWDGPSGPTFDTKSFMRGSLVHDVFYQLMREGLLPQSCRIPADELLKKICIEDGMNKFRAWYVCKSVKKFAGGSAKPDILIAP